ncbi:hypothetical protein [Aequorivita echinoideorum]|uniref:hypothetical protein n=1 Tax=Aequorivita echinoideorum TaxID=1549647 RepID=UPI001BD96FE3|nr:hypothetical protein [Aequorivita echinoideorum]
MAKITAEFEVESIIGKRKYQTKGSTKLDLKLNSSIETDEKNTSKKNGTLQHLTL